MHKKIRNALLLKQLTGLSNPACAYELLTTEQLHNSEKEELKEMLIDDLGLAYLYAKTNRLLGKWPLFDAAIQDGFELYERESQSTKLDRNEFLDLYLYMHRAQGSRK